MCYFMPSQHSGEWIVANNIKFVQVFRLFTTVGGHGTDKLHIISIINIFWK